VGERRSSLEKSGGTTFPLNLSTDRHRRHNHKIIRDLYFPTAVLFRIPYKISLKIISVLDMQSSFVFTRIFIYRRHI